MAAASSAKEMPTSSKLRVPLTLLSYDNEQWAIKFWGTSSLFMYSPSLSSKLEQHLHCSPIFLFSWINKDQHQGSLFALVSCETMGSAGQRVFFQDFLPVMANRLGGDGLMKELCNGFQLLMDKDKGVITLESLRKNSAILGLQDMVEDELVSMLREGDLDGDGSISEMEFCVLMFRLCPQLMEDSLFWLEESLQEELNLP